LGGGGKKNPEKKKNQKGSLTEHHPNGSIYWDRLGAGFSLNRVGEGKWTKLLEKKDNPWQSEKKKPDEGGEKNLRNLKKAASKEDREKSRRD